MKDISRRKLLFAPPIAGLALACLVPGKACSGEKVPAAGGHFWIGPFPLGDWYKTRQDKRSPFNVGEGPTYDEIVKSLDECQVYLLDVCVATASGEKRFGANVDGFPRVVFAGKIYHTWTVEKKEFSISVLEGNSVGRLTDYDRSPPVRTIRTIQTKLRFEGENWFAKGVCEQFHQLRRPIAYDLNGKETW